MNHRNILTKWLIYTLGLFPVWVLDAIILPRYPIGGVSPMLLPAAVAAVAVLEGAFAGTGFGLAVGLFWELAYPGGMGALVIGMALAGMLAGAVSQYALQQSLPGCLLCSAGALIFLDAFRIARALFVGQASLSVLLKVAVPEVLLSLVWTLPVWFLFQAIHRRVGGTRLA